MADALELTVDGRAVRMSNPDRVYFPERGITKGDVLQYFPAVGEGILRALHERPTTLERWPGGVVPGAKLSTRQDHRGDAFFQSAGTPFRSERSRSRFPGYVGAGC